MTIIILACLILSCWRNTRKNELSLEIVVLPKLCKNAALILLWIPVNAKVKNCIHRNSMQMQINC